MPTGLKSMIAPCVSKLTSVLSKISNSQNSSHPKLHLTLVSIQFFFLATWATNRRVKKSNQNLISCDCFVFFDDEKEKKYNGEGQSKRLFVDTTLHGNQSI